MDAITGEAVITCDGLPHRDHWSYALDRDETIVASAGDQTVRIWDRKTGKSKAIFETPAAMMGPLAFSPDDKILACGFIRGFGVNASMDGNGLLIYEVSSGKVLEQIETNRCGICTMAFSPDGKLLATAGTDSLIRLWTVPAAWRKKGK